MYFPKPLGKTNEPLSVFTGLTDTVIILLVCFPAQGHVYLLAKFSKMLHLLRSIELVPC